MGSGGGWGAKTGLMHVLFLRLEGIDWVEDDITITISSYSGVEEKVSLFAVGRLW